MTKDETLKMALEALERSVATCFDRYAHEQVMSRPEHFINQAITAIKAALVTKDVSSSQQEPVAWWDAKLGVFDEKHFDQLQPLYTSPPKREWVGLTEEETIAIVDKHTFDENGYSIYTDGEAVARAVELVLRGKNQ